MVPQPPPLETVTPMRTVLASTLALALFAAGCAGGKQRAEIPPEELYRQATVALEKKRYEQARELTEQLRDDHPFSPFAVEAELLAADVAFRDDKFEEAAAAYRSFEELHPTHAKVPYAVYWRGVSYYNRSLPAPRDQTASRNATEAFQKLLYAYPDSEFAPKAREMITELRSRLAAHELDVARYYEGQKKYRAALQRLQFVVQQYPDTPERDQAQQKALELQERAQATGQN